jgi:glutathione S-transferase
VSSSQDWQQHLAAYANALPPNSAIVEFIAELFPDSGLLPADPVQRAKARFFVHTASNSFIEATLGYLLRGQPGADVLKGATVLDKMLVGKFAIGDQFTVADVALVPLLLSAETALQFKDPDGVLAQLQGLKRLWQYLQDVKTRPSVASAWHSVRLSPCKAVVIADVDS